MAAKRHPVRCICYIPSAGITVSGYGKRRW